MMPAYLATNMAAIIASFMGLSVISAGKTMVGYPTARFFLFERGAPDNDLVFQRLFDRAGTAIDHQFP